jgi:hypothetical protein
MRFCTVKKRSILLQIAADYDLLVDRAAEWVRSKELLNPHLEQ